MEINFNKIKEIYGLDILNLIKENISDVTTNINYMRKLNFEDLEDIFERYTLIFICSPKEFVSKINKLIKKLGIDYVNIIENNMDLLEELS